jgi:nucleoporin SEH1
VRNRWEKLDQFEVHVAPVKDMAWAPNLCRPYEILATVGEEDVATLFKWENDSLQKLQVLDCGEPDLWRVAWNITGTLLAVSPESGQVSVWKTDAGHKWFNVCDIASPGVN